MTGYITKTKTSFVKFWPTIENKKDAKKRANKVLKYIKKYSKGKAILELGCGIGGVLAHFPKKYDLYGLDYGKDYVNYARKRLKNKHIYTSSMHNFKINKKFDVIFSIFDSINFLDNLTQYKQCFNQVKKHLKPNGIFIFDTYTPKILLNQGKKITWKEKFGYIEDTGKVKGNKITWDFKIYEKQGKKHKMHQYYFPETIYKTNKIEKLLTKQFKILGKTDGDNLNKPTNKTTRLLYVTKPNYQNEN